MHYTSWLAPAILLTNSVRAFYPYHGFPATSSEDLVNTAWLSDNHTPTINVKKRRTRLNNRDNNYPVSLASDSTLPHSMGIHQDGQDYSYFSSMKFGSNGKEVWMLIDSGSANTWVFGADCTSQACSKHDTIGEADSETLSITSNKWSVSYGSGDVDGIVASDNVAFAGFDIELGFGLALNASAEFLTYPMDGILGLGRASSNKLGTPTVMDILASQNLLEENIFGIHLSRSADGATDGQITFGSVDTSRFNGELSYTNSIASDGLWEVPVEGASVDGQSLGYTGKTAVIDTGTSYILMPLEDAKALHGKIPGSSNSGETFAIPCDTQLSIQFTFSGVTYDVSPKDYVGKPDKAGKCASNIVGHQSFGPDTWMLGDVYLKNVYTVFDFDNDRIGFGTMNNAASATAAVSSESPTATSSPAAEATAMGSTEGGLGSPMDGKAVSAPIPLLAVLTICLATILAMSTT